MEPNLAVKKATESEIRLYTFLGEAISAVQHLEDALAHAIVLKKEIQHPKRVSKSFADARLAKYQKFTLGDGIKAAMKHVLFDATILDALEEVKEDRNWLVHRSISRRTEEQMSEHTIASLCYKFKSICFKAHNLQRVLETDIIEFSENQGLDMSRVRDEIKRYYS